ncbi:MAG: toprim domain-containing protein [Anaerolineae bacterium]|nr:toprim domain-containing protein [Anaerolineae bacterium]
MRLWRLGYIPADRKDRWGDVDVFLPRGVVIPGLVGSVPWYVKVRRPMDSPKYVHIKGSRPALFGADYLQGKPDLALVEGEFDAILLCRLCGDALDVATFGSASDKDIRLWLPVLVNYGRIWIGLDADPAGQKAASAWLARTRRARLLRVPEGFKDWTDCWKARGDSRLREYILTAVQSNVMMEALNER